MNSKLLLKKAITSGVALTLIATYSLVALANSGKVVGELIVNGSSAIGEGPFVTVNGDPAKNGRSVFSSSTIQTPAEFGAVINIGKTGKIELAPKSTLVIKFDDSTISGELTFGSVTVLNSAREVQVTTLADVVTLNAGETVAADAAKPSKQTKGGGGPHFSAAALAAIFGGIVIAAVLLTNKGNNNTLTGITTVISPVR